MRRAMRRSSIKTLCVAIAAMLGLGPAASAGVGSGYPDYRGRVDASAFGRTIDPEFKRGITILPSAARMLAPGLTRDDLYRLFGQPNGQESFGQPWTYVLRFYTGVGVESVICRVMVKFEGAGAPFKPQLVKDVIWEYQTCADRVYTVYP